MFWVYATDGSNYRRERQISLAGHHLIQSVSRKGGWTASASELLIGLGVAPANHAIVIDTQPRAPTAHLFEVTAISGFTYAGWTPVMLSLAMLFDGHVPRGPLADFKREFDVSACERQPVRTILYVMGGYDGGPWTWGGRGPTSAALLESDAWDYFQEAAAG